MADLIWRRSESSFSSWSATRMSDSSSTPPVSPARVIATNSGEKTFGWRSSASDSGRPASTSLRTLTIVSASGLDSVCASSTYSARRIVMPELTIVASWRVMIVRSSALTLSRNARLISLDACLSAMSRTISPRALSWSETTCLLSASTSPVAFAPVRSIALKTYVAIASLALRRARRRAALRGHPEAAHAHQAAQLVRRRRALLGHALGDLAGAHERREGGVHRLHADARARLHRRRDLVGL